MSKKVDPVHFKFPQPTGTYAVGIKSLYLIDHYRKESYAPATESCRELMVTAWYPTDAKSVGSEPYAPDYLMNAIKGFLKPFGEISENDLSEIDSISVPVISDAPISAQEQSFPLIIFSHGYYGSRFYCSALCQELASHGYVVIAIDHTYDAGVTELPAGRIASWASLTDDPTTSDAFYDTFNTRIEVRVADIRFLLDCVSQHVDPLFKPVDMSNIGLFGQSLGAEAALQAAAVDERIRAVAAMDLFPVGKSIASARNVPCMSLMAELTDWSKLECSEKMHSHIAKRTKELEARCIYHVSLKGADHVVFSDFALFSHMSIFKKLPHGSMFSIGSIDGFEAIKITRTYLVAFFDKILRHNESAALQKGTDDQHHCLIVK